MLAVHASPNAVNGHTVEIFEFQDNKWETVYDMNDDGAFGRGMSLSRDGGRIAVGAPWDDCNGTESGNARVYQLSEITSASEIQPKMIHIYPNPVNEVIQFNNLVEDSHIRVSDATGRLVFEGGIEDEHVNTQQWPQGVLTIQISSSGSILEVMRVLKN